MCRHSLSSLSPENWPFSLEWLPQPAYLVGGAVRDALLGRRSEYLDLDFVLPSGAVQIARAIALRYQAGFVLLDAERQIARVVFGQATADFAQQEGSSLETDLLRRDFSVNAIAYNPYTSQIVDPLNGCEDLQQGLLRMVSPANLQNDPLRLLRAYRQAAQLGFVIEPETREVIRDLAPQLAQVAAERVRVEFGYLLGSAEGTPWIKAAWEDGLIKTWFGNATPNLEQLAAVDVSAVTLAETWPRLGMELSHTVRDSVKTSWLAIAKLTSLVTPDPEIAEIELMHLTYSRAEIKAVTTALKVLPSLQSALTRCGFLSSEPASKEEVASKRSQYFLFRSAGEVFPVVALLAVASGTTVAALAPLINRYLNPNDPVAHPTALVTGNQLMRFLQLPPGPQVGKLLTEIQIAQAEGQISTSTEALQLASQLVNVDREQGAI